MESIDPETKDWALEIFSEEKINQFLEGFHEDFIYDIFTQPKLELLLSSTMKINVQVDRSKFESIPDNYFTLFNRLGYSDNDIVEATKNRKSRKFFSFDSVYEDLFRISPSLIIKQTTNRDLFLSKF